MKYKVFYKGSFIIEEDNLDNAWREAIDVLDADEEILNVEEIY